MMKKMFLFWIPLFLLLDEHRSEGEYDLPSREEVEKNDGSAPPCISKDWNKKINKQYEILKSGDSLTDKDGNTKTGNGTKRFSDVKIDVNNPESGPNNIGERKNKNNNRKNKIIIVRMMVLKIFSVQLQNMFCILLRTVLGL